MMDPKHWSLWARRAFVLTFPISAPLLLAWIVVSTLAAGALAVCILPFWAAFEYCRDLWRAAHQGAGEP